MADATPSWCIDFAYVEQGCLFVFGWFVEPGPGFQGLLLHLNGRHVDLARNVIRVPRPDVPSSVKARRSTHDHGLIVAVEVGPEIAAGDPIELWVVLPDGSVQQIAGETSGNQARFVHFARGNLLALLHLLGAVPEAQRAHLTAIADRARTPAEAMELAAADPFTIALICAPLPDLLVVLGRIAEPRRTPAPMELLLGETQARRRLRLMPGPDGTADFLILAEIGGAVQADRYVISQRQVNGRHGVAFAREDVRRGMAALDALLLPLPLDTQLAVLEELTDLFTTRAETDAADTARLRRMWLERVDRLPARIECADPPTRVVLDQARQVGPHGVFLVGWTVHDPDYVRSISFRAPGIASYDLPPVWVADQRHDVWTALRAEGARVDTDELGFTCYVPVGLADTTGCTLAVTLIDGTVLRMRVDIAPTPDEPLELIKRILGTFPQTHRQLRTLLDHHIGPAVGALWSGRRSIASEPAIIQFGPRPEAPEVSIVVPIYGRQDFIEFQLAQFANDPAMIGQELIYVIDDPSLYDAVRVAAIDLYGCYAVPFTLVYGHRNGGFAVATNLGAAQARGTFLLLLNSDVLPRDPGWLAALVTAHRLHDAGAVGPKLLYEDGSIQHAGMKFYRLPVWGNLWVNDHPLKGQPNSPATETIPCNALTGACLLLRTALFRDLGGLSEDYIIGDFEDSDLCLRLLQEGKQNYLVPSVELYHLERQSQNMIGTSDWRTNLTLYNCWLHDQRWDADITLLEAAP
jgi:GT2 family glycosyltransferase